MGTTVHAARHVLGPQFGVVSLVSDGPPRPHHPAQAIVDDALSNGVLVCVHRLSALDRLFVKMPPSLRLAVTSEHTAEDLQTAADALTAAAKRVLKL